MTKPDLTTARKLLGFPLATADAHDVLMPDSRLAHVVVGHTDGANPCVTLSAEVINSDAHGPTWQPLALLHLEPRAARHIAYAILMAANSCES